MVDAASLRMGGRSMDKVKFAIKQTPYHYTKNTSNNAMWTPFRPAAAADATPAPDTGGGGRGKQPAVERAPLSRPVVSAARSCVARRWGPSLGPESVLMQVTYRFDRHITATKVRNRYRLKVSCVHDLGVTSANRDALFDLAGPVRLWKSRT